MSWPDNIDDVEFSEFALRVYKFDVMGYVAYCFSYESVVPYMREFFDEVSTGKVLWETAKRNILTKIAKKEFPEMKEEKIIFHINHKGFIGVLGSKLELTFRELESSQSIKNIIREIKINQIVD